ncbi:hypothetical protein [Mangrovimonas sp. TPBH4]|uniref:hypothetical protein n=1 Tax=Mangrovimonas sp. TPBH4 TaxID=1645914 RepID=UPI0006B6741E|nr:hypothetical protein [Mangrovimonas sp. TPBH4]
MKNKFIKIYLMVFALIVTTACSDDDLTGHSTMEPSTPTLSVALDFANNQTLVEEETTYGFTVSISEPQIVNVRVYLEQTAGDATDGEDFSFPHSVTIPAGSTSVSDVIAIHADDLIEETETATIKIGTGNESNVSAVNEQVVTFNIQNLVEGDLMIGMSWETATTVTDNFGTELGATDVADLRLLITDVPYTEILGGADGGSFETYTISSDTPDGDYYVVADYYSAMDIPVDLNLHLTFDQTGVINGEEYSFAGAMNTGNSCSSVYYIMAQITKMGDSYTITEVGEPSPVTAAPFIGTATVVTDEWADYSPGDTIEIEAGANEYEFWIRAYANPYIENPDTAYFIVTVDPATANVTLMSNEDFQYGCSEGDVTGSGSVNACAGTIDLVLDFGLGNCGDYPGYGFSLQL